MGFGGVFQVPGGGEILVASQCHVEQCARVCVAQVQSREVLHNLQREIRKRVFVGRTDDYVGEHAVVAPVFAVVHIKRRDGDGHLADGGAQEFQCTESEKVVQGGTIQLGSHGVEHRSPIPDGNAHQVILVAQRQLVVEHDLFHQSLDVPNVGVGGQLTFYWRAIQNAVAVAVIVVFQHLGHATMPHRQIRRIVLLLRNLRCNGLIYGVEAVVIAHQIVFILIQQAFDIFRRLLCENVCHKNQGQG